MISLAKELSLKEGKDAEVKAGELLLACVNLAGLRGAECEIALKESTEAFVEDFTSDDEA